MENSKLNFLHYSLLTVFFLAFIIIGIVIIKSSINIYDTTVEIAWKSNSPEKICTLCINNGYSQAFVYFSISLGILFLVMLLPRLQSIGFGGFSLGLRELKSELEVLKTQNNLVQENLVKSGGKFLSKEDLSRIKENAKKQVEPGTKGFIDSTNDPNKNKWGSLAERSGRKLTAIINKAVNPLLFEVVLTVESSKPLNPLKGFVEFHLHPTFNNPNPIIAVLNGKAELRLANVYGAFTVGAEADNGLTQLELDLSKVPNTPEGFN